MSSGCPDASGALRVGGSRVVRDAAPGDCGQRAVGTRGGAKAQGMASVLGDLDRLANRESRAEAGRRGLARAGLIWPHGDAPKRGVAEVTIHCAHGLHVTSNLFERGPERCGLSLLGGALPGEVLRG